MKSDLIPALAFSAMLALPAAALANEPEQPTAPPADSQLVAYSSDESRERPGEGSDGASAGEQQGGSTQSGEQSAD